jgi:hypothetical protein
MNSGQTQVVFVNFEYLQKNSPIYANLDSADINWVIPISQDIHIKSIIGSALYTKLIDDIITNGNTTGLYANLLDNFICPALVYYIALDAADFNSIKWTNKGLLKKTSETSEIPTQQDITGYKNKLEKFAEFYGTKITEYLEANPNSFPEYQNPVVQLVIP